MNANRSAAVMAQSALAARTQRANSRVPVRPPHDAPPEGAELATHLLPIRIFLY